MPRRAINPTALMKWRLDQSIPTGEIVKKTGITQASVYRIERGEAVSRNLANKYLSFWGGNLQNLSRLPAQLQIIDEGWAVRLSFSQQKIE